MALNYNQLQDVLNRTFQEPLQDYVVRANPILAATPKRAVSSDRIYIKGISDTTHNPGAVADGTDISMVGDEGTTYINPVLDWATYVAKFKVPKRLIEQLSGQPGMIGNILQSEIQLAAKDLSDKIAEDLFGTTVSNGIVGIIDMVNDGNTYAGIDRNLAANANWQSAVKDATGAELSTNALYEADELFFSKNGYGFTETPARFTAVTDRKIMTKYKSLMENIDLGTLGDAHFVNQANGTGNLGLGSVGFAGVPVIRDRNVVADSGDSVDTSRLYFLDMSKIELAVLESNPSRSMVHQVQGFQTAPSTQGIRTYIEILGNKGENVEGYVKTYVQLATPDAKAAGVVIKNIKNT